MYNLSTYSLLLSPGYRILRYILLCTILFMFAYSEMLFHYQGIDTFPFIVLTLNAFLCKLVMSLILIVVLIPFLLRQQYMIFWILILSLVFIFVWLQHIAFENMLCSYFNLSSWKEDVHFMHILIEIIAQNALWLMVILGILMGRILKYWSKEYEYKQQIQASGLQMEKEAMKEQVAPALLCSSLRCCGESAERAPEETSAILMKLSRLLRYQLYDCRQEKVLLESEMKFLKEYLFILRYNAGCADFNLSVSGSTMGILIPPLLFVPFLQSEEVPDKHTFIDISIRVYNDTFTFELTDDHIQRNDANIRKRLQQFYPQKHSLIVEPKHVMLKIQIR